jgi:hypothetical protein
MTRSQGGAVSLLMWIGVGSIVGFAAARTRAAWDRRPRRAFIGAGITGALVGGVLASVAGFGSIISVFAPSTWLVAALFAVLGVTIYQTSQ